MNKIEVSFSMQLQDLYNLPQSMEPGILLFTRKSLMSVCDLNLKHTWVLKQDNDLKHTEVNLWKN